MVFWGQKDRILRGFVPKSSFLCWWMRKNTPKRSSLVPRGSKKAVKTAAHMYHPSYREYPPPTLPLWLVTKATRPSDTVVSFTKEVTSRFAKRPLVFNGRLANLGLTSLVKEGSLVGGYKYIWVPQYVHVWTNGVPGMGLPLRAH